MTTRGGKSAAACALCGTPCRGPFQAPAAELAPDLDLRPGEPTRSTLGRWIVTCRGCGASAPDLAALGGSARGVVESEGYRALARAGAEFGFRRWGMLCEAAGDRVGAAEALLEAAWALDDREDACGARTLRAGAAALWGEPGTVQEGLRLVDVLRRAGSLGAARERAEGLLRGGVEETDAAVLRYQLGLIAAQDLGRHLLSSALRPPARTPHVSHKRGVRRGFWQRLFGG